MNRKMIDLLIYYDNVIRDDSIPIKQVEDHTRSDLQRLEHLRWMIDQMLHTADPRLLGKFQKPETVNRWLGFIQGVMWAAGYFGIKELRDQSRDLNGPKQE